MYFEKISQHQGRLYGFIKSLHFNEEEAKDILQDTNVTLINKQDDFDGEKEFTPWAFGIARFTLLAHKKRRAKEGKKITYSSPHLDLLLDLKDESLKQDLAYEVEQERLYLLKVVRQHLTPKQRILIDKLLEGKTIAQIAEELGSRPHTVSVLKVRAIRRIKDTILKLRQTQKHDYKA